MLKSKQIRLDKI